jgi:hypothetical protein
MGRGDLTDGQWAALASVLPHRRGWLATDVAKSGSRLMGSAGGCARCSVAGWAVPVWARALIRMSGRLDRVCQGSLQ